MGDYMLNDIQKSFDPKLIAEYNQHRKSKIPLDYVVPNSQTATLGKGRVQQFLEQYHKGNHH